MTTHDNTRTKYKDKHIFCTMSIHVRTLHFHSCMNGGTPDFIKELTKIMEIIVPFTLASKNPNLSRIRVFR